MRVALYPHFAHLRMSKGAAMRLLCTYPRSLLPAAVALLLAACPAAFAANCCPAPLATCPSAATTVVAGHSFAADIGGSTAPATASESAKNLWVFHSAPVPPRQAAVLGDLDTAAARTVRSRPRTTQSRPRLAPGRSRTSAAAFRSLSSGGRASTPR